MDEFLSEKEQVEEIRKWWKENGSIPSSQTKDVDCYEPTEFTRRTDELIGMMDEMLEIIRKDKKS